MSGHAGGVAGSPGARKARTAWDHRPPPEVRAKWAKKTREARGYGTAHRSLQANVARVVAAVSAICARCGLSIEPVQPWDLDYGDDRTSY
jgi:hypothetical protein